MEGEEELITEERERIKRGDGTRKTKGGEAEEEKMRKERRMIRKDRS